MLWKHKISELFKNNNHKIRVLSSNEDIAKYATNGISLLPPSLVFAVVVIQMCMDRFYTHDTRSRNRRNKLTPFSGADLIFVPCATGMKISGAENKDD